MGDVPPLNGPGRGSRDPPNLSGARLGPRGPLTPQRDPSFESRHSPPSHTHPSPSGPAGEGQGPPPRHTVLLIIHCDFCCVGRGGGFGFINCHIKIAETGFMEAWLS